MGLGSNGDISFNLVRLLNEYYAPKAASQKAQKHRPSTNHVVQRSTADEYDSDSSNSNDSNFIVTPHEDYTPTFESDWSSPSHEGWSSISDDSCSTSYSSSMDFNTNGLPMIEGAGIDVGGHAYGSTEI